MMGEPFILGDKINGIKISLLVSVILMISLIIFSKIEFLIIIAPLLGLATVWEAYMLKKECRYANIYLEVINKIKEDYK